jgi:hypothetical protein
MMHPEITMAIARQESADRIRAGWSRRRGGADRTRPVKALRRIFGG